MKISEWEEAKRYMVKPPSPYTKEEKKEIVKDFYKKAEQPKSKPMPILKYINTINKLYSNSEDPGYIDPKEMEDIKKSLPVSEMVKEERFNDKILKRDKYEPKKKIIKVAKKPRPKPTYLNGNVIDITPLIDDDWWTIFGEDPPEEESRLLLVPKSKAEGITSILNLHKKLV